MRGSAWLAVVALLVTTGGARASAPAPTEEEPHPVASQGSRDSLAPGWQPLAYPAPSPGTYALPSLGVAADGEVLDIAGERRRLHDVFGGDVVVLSFIYATCPDPNGCPLAGYVLGGVHQRVLEDPSAKGRVRLVSLSFDPEHDSPAVLRQHAAGFTRDGESWTFLTTDSQEALAPILESYGQAVQKEYDRSGKPLGTFSHLLRVFLIDPQMRIRNVYTSGFLHADTLWSDIQTVLDEETRAASHDAEPGEVEEPAPASEPEKRQAQDEVRSKSLASRKGTPADLVRLYREPALGLPTPRAPEDNPVTSEKIALGRKLFFDRRLSRNQTVSCALCHVPEQGFTSNQISTAVGIEGRTVRRNAPTIYNAAYADLLFADGRGSRLEQQVWEPLLASNEMGNASAESVLERIRALPDYAGLFEAAFGGRGPSVETVGMALASYERTLLSGSSPFDRWYFGNEPDALSPAAKRGFRLFTGKAGCSACHALAEHHALFTDQQLHNTGIGYRQSTARAPRTQRLEVAPGEVLTIDLDVVSTASETPPTDLGRYEITARDEDRWKYKTPSLRNVALTRPYMHDGSIGSLREVVDFYDQGGIPNPGLDARLRPLHLGEEEKIDLVAFLESLTGDDVSVIVADAFAAPVGDPG